MKKWTVMLIPHDRSSTRTLTVSSLHFWIVTVVLIALSFSTALLFQRHRALADRTTDLKQAYRSLELQLGHAQSAQPQPKAAPSGVPEEEVREMEARLRSQYEASIAAITSELGKLYDMEAKARDITGLAPRTAENEDAVDGDGKGGGAGGFGFISYNDEDGGVRPSHIIYGLSRPSADLILQEIRLRTQSYQELVEDMEAEIDRVERIPSLWPLADNRGRLTSRYGYRRDPFTGRVRHHNGIDVAASHGASVRASAKGTVVYSGWDNLYGNLIKIDHGNGMETWYAHLSKRLADKGEFVERDTIIGKLGSTGRSTGPHLHYEVRVNDKVVDAEKYLSK